MRDQERLKRVLAWLDIIAAEVVELLINNYAFWQVQEVIRANKELQHAESVFFEWMVSVFAHSAAVGVRRQAALDDQSVSLHRLLVELQKYPHLVTREYHRNLFKNKSTRVQQLVDHAYDNYVGLGRTELDPARIQIDIDLLAAASKKIHHYTDRVVAHYDEKGLRQPVPTFHDLSKCLLEMEELVLKYLELVKGESKITLLPTFLYDWKSIFRTPWIVETGGSLHVLRRSVLSCHGVIQGFGVCMARWLGGGGPGAKCWRTVVWSNRWSSLLFLCYGGARSRRAR